MRRFEIASELDAGAEEVWAHATSPAGVNYEMAPWLRMTFPRDAGNLTEVWAPGRTLFRSWLLAGGVLPVEYDDIAFAAVEPGRRFLERSVLLSQRVWEHERVVEPLGAPGGGCRVTDRLGFEPRIARLEALYEAVFRRMFAHRHRRLRKRFGAGRAV
jgi:ligand-binding SRPBCC domain-containing protein